MNVRALGIYREPEFSPGKVSADAAILDAVLVELAHHGVKTSAVDARAFAAGAGTGTGNPDLILAMCQGEDALRRLAECERAGASAINSALAIRNCYRDLLAQGLERAGVPTPPGALVATDAPLEVRTLGGVDVSAPVFIKRGDLHALGPDDVQRAFGRLDIEGRLTAFARRGVRSVYVQQEVPGTVIKFYGVSDRQYFAIQPESGAIAEEAARSLAEAAHTAAEVLGLEAWGGDAALSGERFAIIDFNDWPSYSRVRTLAARAIARRALSMLARPRAAAEAV